jgi:hypothetical protein
MAAEKRIEDLPLVLPGQQSLDRWALYQERKQRIAERGLPPAEYEAEIRKLAAELGV